MIILDELYHYGVKGMKWGVRKNGGVSRAVNRRAKKDAKEYTQAKMFYGEGAGTRRKLIKAKVEHRSKNIPGYKDAFDQHVSNTDMGARANQAQRQRTRKDVAKTTKKHVRGTLNILNGNSMSAAGTTVAAVTVGKLVYDNGGKEFVNKYLNEAISYMNNR